MVNATFITKNLLMNYNNKTAGGFFATTSNIHQIGRNFHHRFLNGCSLKQYYSFGENQIWLLITSSQTEKSGLFGNYSKSNLCLSDNFPSKGQATNVLLDAN